jgi:5'-nucleotidase
MKLLVTNDDGIHALGIYALIKELEKYHDVLVVAPDDQRSASSHSITLTKPLIVRKVQLEGIKSDAYSISGTPADCVRIAVDQLMEHKVDMIVSGINRGFNLGTDVVYSGTVSAAIEGAICKIPSVAVSTEVTDNLEDYEVAAQYAREAVERAKEHNIHDDFVLNINVPRLPREDIKGIKVCPMGGRVYNDSFIEIDSEDQGRVYEVRGHIVDIQKKDTDTYYIKQGYVTLTPLHYDITNFKTIQEVGGWF